MKRHDFAVLLGLSLILNGCSAAPSVSSTGITVSQEEATLIQLGDDQILINGPASRRNRCSAAFARYRLL